MIMQAILFFLTVFLTSSILLYGSDIVSFALDFVTPNEFGIPNVDAPEPAFIKNESPCP